VFLLGGPLVGALVFELASRLIGQPTGELLSAQLTRVPLLVGLSAFLFWEVLGGLAFTLTDRSHYAALRNQGHLYEAVFRSLSEGVALAGADGRLILFNAAAEKILGMGVRQVEARFWTRTYGIFHPDGKTPFPPDQLPLAQALEGKTVLDTEMFIRNPNVPDGVWISVSGAPIKDDLGQMLGGVVVFHDIGERKKMAAELRKSVKELEDLKYAVDQAAIVVVTDPRGTIQYANEEFCAISGYSPGELLGQTHRLVNSVYHPREFFADMWRDILAAKVWRGEIRNRAKGGQYYWVDTTIVPFLSADGRPERLLAIGTDMTARKRHEEQLLRLYSAVEQAADSVFITNTEGVIEYVNPAFETSTGYSREEALGQTPRLLKSGRQTPEHYELLWKTIRAGETYRSVIVNRKKSGEHYYAEQSISPVKDPQGNIINFVSVVKDITDRMKREEHEIEMHFASLVQRRLYPDHAPEIEGLDIAGATFPAVATGGDYYDFMPMHGGLLGVVVGDVSGHGLGPAIIVAETRAHLRCLAMFESDLCEIMNSTNRALYADLEDYRYVALVLCGIDVSSRRLSYANAGHVPGYLLDRNGDLKLVLDSTGIPLGIFGSTAYACNLSIALEPGDMVVLLTDGITEAEDPSGDFFGAERALQIVRDRRHEPAQRIVQDLYQATRDFAQNPTQADDVTVVVFKVGPLASRSPHE
jgi:sigma-B regulation protein RsbU (phosphoserine phosphatase)